MTHQLLVFSTLILIPFTSGAEEPTQNKAVKPSPNPVYVKIIMPKAWNDLNKDRPVIESWIAEELVKRGQAKCTAMTGWVSLDLSPFDGTRVWDGVLGKQSYCPVGADIRDRSKGRIKLHLGGWSPGGAFVNVSLKDEPGSRMITAVEEFKMEHGTPYVAVFVGPPSEELAAPTDE